MVLIAVAAPFGCERPPETLTHCEGTEYTFGPTRVHPPSEQNHHTLVLIDQDDVNSILDLADGSITPIHEPGELLGFAIATARPVVRVHGANTLRFFDWSTRPPHEIALFDNPRAFEGVLSPNGLRVAVLRIADDRSGPEVLIYHTQTSEVEAAFKDLGWIFQVRWRDDAMLAIGTVDGEYCFVTRDADGWRERPDLKLMKLESTLTECFLGEGLIVRVGAELVFPNGVRIHGCHLMNAICLDESTVVINCDTAAVIHTKDAALARFEPPSPMAVLAVRAAPIGWRFAYAMDGAIWEVPIDEAYQWGEPVRVAALPEAVAVRKKRD